MQRLHEGYILADRYVLEERIASGGMADVWSGTDNVLKRSVAIKIMRPDVGREQLFALRFRDEAVHSAGLSHNNIATLFDYGEHDGLAFLVMELVQGKPLSALLAERGRLPFAEVRSILSQAALALGVAHEARVVHRDVKPANILVRPDGVVKLTDFGIARALDASGHTRHGELLGTPNYISPEQAMGDPATASSDLYALGVVAHEMLSGQRPFDKGTPIATALSHVREEPPPLPDDVPEDLAALVAECLAKDAADRPASAGEVAVRLGLGDNIIGLALDLAQALNGQSEEPERVGDPVPEASAVWEPDAAPEEHRATHPQPLEPTRRLHVDFREFTA